MRTKRYIALLLAALMALSLAACGKDEDKSGHAAASIYPAKLTAEEEALIDLLGIGMDPYRIFDFQMGSETQGVQSIRLRAYELVGGDWNCVADASRTFTDDVGRLALTFGKMTEGVQMAWQSENNSGGTSFTMEEGEEETGLIYATSALTDSPSIELDQEVPLVLQIATSKSEFSSYQVDYFGMPRELAKHDYEHVYAITVTFSKEQAKQPTVTESQGPSGEPASTGEPAPTPES